MIAWPIAAALESKVFSRVIVSTDDDEIAGVAAAAGAEVPFVRPKELSGDHTGLMEVIRHAIHWLSIQGKIAPFFGCIYATAAFLRAADLKCAIGRLRTHPSAEFVISVGTYPVSPFQAMKVCDGDMLTFAWPEFAQERTQDLPEAFFDAAQFLFGRTSQFINYPNTLSGWSIPYVLPRLLCQDIDTVEDWEHAETLFELLNIKKGNQPFLTA